MKFQLMTAFVMSTMNVAQANLQATLVKLPVHIKTLVSLVNLCISFCIDNNIINYPDLLRTLVELVSDGIIMIYLLVFTYYYIYIYSRLY